MSLFLILPLAALVLLINAALVACEFGLIKLRYSLIDDEGLDTFRSRIPVARLLERADQTARAIRLGLTACTVAWGVLLFPVLSAVYGQFNDPGGAIFLTVVAFLLALGIRHVLGDLIPRGFALAQPQWALRLSALPVWLIRGAASPGLWLLRSIARRMLGWMGLAVTEGFNLLDIEVQIRALADDEPNLTAPIKKVLRNTLRLRELDVSDILLPRNQVQYFDLHAPLSENLELARHTGHTRFPLCESDLDKCIGIIHIKDIFRYRGDQRRLDLRRMRREIISVSVDDSLENVLQQLLAQKIHMALAVDDFGGTVGVITLESILEELVGEIHDEFDTPEEELIKQADDGFLEVSGLTPLHDLEEQLGVTIENEDVSTVGGFVTSELGRLPEAGETIRLEQPPLDITITDVDERRILSLLVRRSPVESIPEEAD